MPFLGPHELESELQYRDIQVGRGGLTPLAPTICSISKSDSPALWWL